MAERKENTIPIAFGHFDDLIKSFVKNSTNQFDSLIKPEPPKIKQKQVGKKFSNPFFEN
tara:strand:+ start:296 stop:472 length:177 start_codon:yes stop_codon:yes gene_type:complete